MCPLGLELRLGSVLDSPLKHIQHGLLCRLGLELRLGSVLDSPLSCIHYGLLCRLGLGLQLWLGSVLDSPLRAWPPVLVRVRVRVMVRVSFRLATYMYSVWLPVSVNDTPFPAVPFLAFPSPSFSAVD